MAKTMDESLRDLKTQMSSIDSIMSDLGDTFTDIYKILQNTNKMFQQNSSSAEKTQRQTRSFYSDLFSDLRRVNEYLNKNNKEQNDFLEKMSKRHYLRESDLGYSDRPSTETSIGISNGSVFKRMQDTELLLQEQRKYREFLDEVLENSQTLTDEQRRYFQALRDDAQDTIDSLKNVKGVPTRLLHQMRENEGVAEKGEEERRQIDQVLQGIAEGRVKATEEDVKNLKEQRDKLKTYSDELPEGFFSSFGSTMFSRGSYFSDLRKTVGRNRNLDEQGKTQNEEYEKELRELENANKEGRISSSEYERQKKSIEDNRKAMNESTDDIKKTNWKDFAKSVFSSILKELGKLAAEQIKKFFQQAWQTMNDAATYSTSTSMLVNSSAREQQLRYGLSDSQNYAFTQVRKIMGISSDEDLFWMNSNQKQLFQELMQKQTAIYDEMTANGTLASFQKMQVDLAEMKMEFTADIVKFITDNKETILEFMRVVMNVLQVIMNLVTGILSAVSWLHNGIWGTTGNDAGFSYGATDADVQAYRNAARNGTRSYSSGTSSYSKYEVNINTENKNSGELSSAISDRVKAAMMNYVQS